MQSELVANEPQPSPGSKDPRAAAALRAPLQCEFSAANGERVTLVHRTRASRLAVGAAMDHVFDGPDGTAVQSEAEEDLGRVTIATDLQQGERLSLVEVPHLRLVGDTFPAGGAGSGRGGARRGARTPAGTACWRASASRSTCSGTWRTSSSRVTPRSSRRSASALFHAMQAGARAERRAIPAKGLTGPGYDGHAFWDTETFVLPLLTYTAPDAAAAALHWRHSTLPLARERARTLDLHGRHLPVADDRRRGVLGLLAGGHGGVPRVRRRRRRGDPLRAGHRRRGLRARDRRRAAGRDRAAVGVAGPSRRRRRLPHRRRDRARRVQRGGRQQRLHEPDGAAEPARRRRRGRAPPRARARACGVDDEEIAAWRDAAKRWSASLRR